VFFQKKVETIFHQNSSFQTG